MPTYATEDDLDGYIAGLTDNAETRAVAVALLEPAERQVDTLLGALAPLQATGLKLDPAWLEARVAPWARRALSRAVCAQVEYLVTVGPGVFIEGERLASLVAGPDFQKSYGSGADRPRLGPKVADELEPLLRAIRPRGARARA